MARSLEAEIRRRFRAREYGGPTHRILRKNLALLVATGMAKRAICETPIPAGAKWDLAHNADRTGYLGPAHARCNRNTAGSVIERKSREW